MKKLIILFIFIPNILFAGSMKVIGNKGQEKNIGRIIKVSMYDNYYQPNKFNIKKNETIKFVIENKGQLVHEFNIATKEMHLKHQPEMMMMVEHEILLADKIDKKKMKEMSKKNPAMAHSHSNSVIVSPGKKAELIWKFSNSVNIEVACNVPGHYDVGMIAKINNL
jgi:uncharacterized cupredoxin-like copper-binding protein